MQLVYLISVWLHILAATVWLGGMAFLVLVVVPWLRRGGGGNASAFLRETGEGFRSVGWTCFAILVLTGSFNLWMRGVRLGDFTRTEWLSSSFGQAVVLKLCGFFTILLVSAVHDFVVGPKAVAAIAADPTSPEARAVRRRASLLGRVNLVLALVVVAIGVVIVRGVPW